MPAELSAVLAFLAVAGSFAALYSKLNAALASNTKLQTEYKDALALISTRADKEAALASSALEALKAFERAVGDKRALESALASERRQNDFLQGRVMELERYVMAVRDPAVESRVVRQGLPEKDEPANETPTRWAAASGTYRPSLTLAEMVSRNQPKPEPVETA